MPTTRSLLRAILQGHRTIVVDGVRYKERSSEPLHRALSDRGSGWKDYDALFPDSSPLRIRCTPQRQYADLVGPRVLAPYTLAEPIIRPGMRVLDIRCATGYGADHTARLVGPSGAVVALDPDHESIRFARRRYDPGNISFEIGGLEAIEGELDASFDAVLAVNFFRATQDTPHDAAHPPPHAARDAAALWRVLAPGGPMLLVQQLPPAVKPSTEPTPAAETQDDAPLRLSTAELRNLLLDLAPSPGIEPAETIELAAIIARKPAETPQKPPHDPGRSYPPMR